MFYYIISTRYQKIGDLFWPDIFLDFRTVWLHFLLIVWLLLFLAALSLKRAVLQRGFCCCFTFCCSFRTATWNEYCQVSTQNNRIYKIKFYIFSLICLLLFSLRVAAGNHNFWMIPNWFYESKWFPWSSRINFIPFRIFRGPLFHKLRPLK